MITKDHEEHQGVPLARGQSQDSVARRLIWRAERALGVLGDLGELGVTLRIVRTAQAGQIEPGRSCFSCGSWFDSSSICEAAEKAWVPDFAGMSGIG